MEFEEVVFVAIGTLLILVALLVEIEHKIIWKNHTKHYHKHKNKLADKLLRPNKVVYWLNIYVVWPLVLVLGVTVIYVNL